MRCEELGDVEGPAARRLLDLFPAAEAVRQNHGFGPCLADFRNQGALGNLLRNVVFFAFESERAGHAATARVQDPVVELSAVEHLSFGARIENSMLMAMNLDQCRPGDPRQLSV